MSFAFADRVDTSRQSDQGEELVAQTRELLPERVRRAFSGDVQSTDAREISPNTVTLERYALPAAGTGLRFLAPAIDKNLVKFVSEQRWQGYVSNADDTSFRAVIFEMSSDKSVDEDADASEEIEFNKNEVAEMMHSFVQPGAIFFWDVGFQIDSSGQWNRHSIISFPMIPIHTETQYEEALERAKSRFRELGWDKLENVRPWLKYYPAGMRWDTPIDIAPLQSVLEMSAKRFGRLPALEFMGWRVSYADLEALANRAAAGLQKIGVGPGAHVGLFLPNSPHYVIAFFGVLKAGGVVVNYPPLDTLRTLECKIADSETDVLVTSQPRLALSAGRETPPLYPPQDPDRWRIRRLGDSRLHRGARGGHRSDGDSEP